MRLLDDADAAWTAYSPAISTKIEKAYSKGQKTMKLDEQYKIDFKEMIQHRNEARFSLSVLSISDVHF